MTGALRMKRTDDSTYWNYIYSDKPKAWEGRRTWRCILNIGSSNTYKQQFKIQGRGDKDLFEMHDDGSAGCDEWPHELHRRVEGRWQACCD